MLTYRSVLIVTTILALSACGTPHRKLQKPDMESTPVNQSWILGAPPHGEKMDVQNTQAIPVKNPDTVEGRLERLENDMAKIKLDLAQLVLPKHAVKTMSHTQQTTQKSSHQKTGVRFGVTGLKTRIVFDLPHAVKFKTDLDNQERFLLIDFQGSNLNLQSGHGKGLVSSYNIDTDTNGMTRAIIILNADTKIIAQEALRPSGKSGHRVFIDVVRN
jgi:hypothetical protein